MSNNNRYVVYENNILEEVYQSLEHAIDHAEYICNNVYNVRILVIDEDETPIEYRIFNDGGNINEKR
jgi:hypothetical protein